MSREGFRTSPLGFNKEDVINYISRLSGLETDGQADAFAALSAQNDKLSERVDELTKQIETMELLSISAPNPELEKKLADAAKRIEELNAREKELLAENAALSASIEDAKRSVAEYEKKLLSGIDHNGDRGNMEELMKEAQVNAAKLIAFAKKEAAAETRKAQAARKTIVDSAETLCSACSDFPDIKALADKISQKLSAVMGATAEFLENVGSAGGLSENNIPSDSKPISEEAEAAEAEKAVAEKKPAAANDKGETKQVKAIDKNTADEPFKSEKSGSASETEKVVVSVDPLEELAKQLEKKLAENPDSEILAQIARDASKASLSTVSDEIPAASESGAEEKKESGKDFGDSAMSEAEFDEKLASELTAKLENFGPKL